MWHLHHRLALDRLPEQRVVVLFSFSGVPRQRRGPHNYWLMLERPEVELCLTDPGHEVDLYVEADLRAFTQVWLGDAPLASASARTRGQTLRAHASSSRRFRTGCCSAASLEFPDRKQRPDNRGRTEPDEADEEPFAVRIRVQADAHELTGKHPDEHGQQCQRRCAG